MVACGEGPPWRRRSVEQNTGARGWSRCFCRVSAALLLLVLRRWLMESRLERWRTRRLLARLFVQLRVRTLAELRLRREQQRRQQLRLRLRERHTRLRTPLK